MTEEHRADLQREQARGDVKLLRMGLFTALAIDELLPTAREYGTGHLAIYGVVAGMAVMAVSLLLFL